LPGTPAIVRSATIVVADVPRSATAGPSPERVLAHWLPGHESEPIDSGAAFRLPAGAQLSVRIHYKKTWQLEGKAMADRSTVGVYFFTDQEAHELLSLTV